MLEHPFPRGIEAPPLDGGLAWINTAGPLSVRDLRGKFVLLDFWTYCCINCMHILPELKKLEQAYPNQLVVIGVHSAKFETEEDSQNITEAVLRHEIEHPVVNDAHHVIWDNFSVASWPSLRIIDPEGNLVAGHSGEIDFETLDGFLKNALPYYRQKGTLDETPVRFELEAFSSARTPLRFPGKILADEKSGRLFIADSNHNRIVMTRLDGTLVDIIGSGEIGRADGDFSNSSFNHPQGMALTRETLYVADTENHLLRKVDLKAKKVTTLAGTGKQGTGWPGSDFAERSAPRRPVGLPLKTPLNSPWDLLVNGKDLYIAMAGPHQIWKMPLDEIEIGPYAGNGREDIVDGPLLPRQPYDEGFASFAQPSGLASDGKNLFVADSEGSSIRSVPFDPGGEVRTVVGTSHLSGARLFTFGDVDGKGRSVRLQHALGVAWNDGVLYVADTYNNKIKAIDAATASASTLAGTGKPGQEDQPAAFDEPAGLSYAAGKLFVADTNNHLIRVIDLKDGNRVSTLAIEGLAPPTPPAPREASPPKDAKRIELTSREVQAVDGSIKLAVKLTLPEGYKINPQAPMSYRLTAPVEPGLIDKGAITKPAKVQPPTAEFEIPLPLTAAEGSATIEVSLGYYYCQEGDKGLCKVGNVTWSVPFQLSPTAADTALPLTLEVQ